ncbi:hypothetical protein Tco_0224135 [Tanacetum coccineum]
MKVTLSVTGILDWLGNSSFILDWLGNGSQLVVLYILGRSVSKATEMTVSVSKAAEMQELLEGNPRLLSQYYDIKGFSDILQISECISRQIVDEFKHRKYPLVVQIFDEHLMRGMLSIEDFSLY